ncbi:MAG: hypothetical protein ACLGHV_13375, partial [Gammaproteobacteria bacterium]
MISTSSGSLPHRQLRKTAAAASFTVCMFTAAQAAQKKEISRALADVAFTAAQAAQKLKAGDVITFNGF